MEQHRTRRPQPPRPRPIPRQGPRPRAETVPERRPAPRAEARPGPRPARGRLPAPRLTALGGGILTSLAMLVVGLLDLLLLGGSPVAYGLLFLPVCAACALWMRPADLVAAPVSVPIAFAVGAVPVSGGTGGLGGHVMALVTALAVQAGWLYGGTLVAGVIVTVRKVRLMTARRARGRAAQMRGA
ncbi:DUF6542 domain-containing protein [Streptomyces sp. GC420]|uniref:DUF6542 domain-containing protein n=1 Tax=Streptomyces sp. GC420 TaxID=2697568 RepID=UPI001414F6D3|nr:DUF6542 domain-containing protein [Streptomyces sp. GC420]NBM18342.1 hypothetical protein [Streptomyces sp. GC420]